MEQQVLICLADYFNSHPHEEDDIGAKEHMKESMYFNSHPHEEDDMMEHFFVLDVKLFQLTSSRRG